ncbi:MAG: outer membrane lipoprotein-sorting protein [Candidatus Omnitrophota bacterium]
MKKVCFAVIIFCLFCFCVEASGLPVEEIVKKRDELMRGESTYGEYEMQLVSPRWKRTLKFTAWSRGKDESLILTTYPKKDKGITFLRINTDMWQYIPKIEKTIKIPPSMMLQSWMGSDFTNDDLVKESSIVSDYTHQLIREDAAVYVIASFPKPAAAVVWGKVVQHIDKNLFVPIKDEFYDEDGVLIKQLVYEDVKPLTDRYYPMRWIMESLTEEKRGHQTVIIVHQLQINQPIEENIFSMQALKRYSD